MLTANCSWFGRHPRLGPCSRQIQTRGGKQPTWQDCPCTYTHPPKETTVTSDAAKIISRLEATYPCPCTLETPNGTTGCLGIVRMTLAGDEFIYACGHCGTQWGQKGQPILRADQIRPALK